MRGDIIILVFLIGILVVASYFLFTLFPRETEYFMQINEISFNPLQPKNYSAIQQFYDNMRFRKLPITYTIERSCPEEKVIRVKKAVEILHQETTLTFQQLQENGEITVTCSGETPLKSKTTFIAGEGGPTSIINTTLYNVILNGSVLLFKKSQCDEPIVEIHELLHVLGFDHSNNPRSVMYNVTNCNQEITPDIIETLDQLYIDEGLADLYFDDVFAAKKGRYIFFEVKIGNRGLADSDPVTLKVYLDDEEVKEFEIKETKIGYIRIITVENLKGSYNTQQLKFVIDQENTVNELNKENNIAILTVES